VGMIPLLYSDPIWVPLATAIIFGLTFSVVITLVLVPIIYDRWPGKLTK
jgi:multidrug efflux pump subunit AcrB